MSLSPAIARGENIFESVMQATYITNIQETGKFAQTSTRLATGGYELAYGEYKSFADWYAPKWFDVRFDFLTQVNENFGFLWSVSTGERAPKYRIDPEYRLGLMYQFELAPLQFLSFSYTRSLGGRLRELPCVADYGEIGGGVQTVNCRLAASILAPDETLQYLVNTPPSGRNWYGLKLRFTF